MLKQLQLKRSTIQRKMLIALLCLAVIPLGLFGYVSFTISKNTIEEQANASNLNTLGLISEKLNIMAADLGAISNIYFSNDDLHSILLQPALGPYEDWAKKQFMTKMIINFKYSNTWLEYNTSIFGFNGFELHTFYDGKKIGLDSFKQEPWYQEVLKQKGGILWIYNPSDKLLPTVNNEPYISAVRVLKDFESGTNVGLLFINVNESFLFKQYGQALKDYDDFFLIDDEGTVISSSNKSLIDTNISKTDYYKHIKTGSDNHFTADVGGRETLVTFKPVEQTGWSIVAFTPLDQLLNNIYKTQLLNIIAFGLVLLVSIPVSYYIARRFSVPVKKLYASMKKVEMGDFSERSEVAREDEIGELSRKFNRMVGKIEELRDSVLREQNMKRKTELNALQSQINTHFLYNTLASIRYMLMTQSLEKVDNTIVALVKLLKKTLSDEREYIPIVEEIENLKNYVLIQKARQNEKLHVEFDIEERIGHYMTLKLLLQPLVENAVFHGIEPKEGPGYIRVKGWLEDGFIWFEVSDDGVGFPVLVSSDVTDITDGVFASEKSTGMGLSNIRHRIQLHYGHGYGMKICRGPLGGTSVYMWLPLFMKAEELKQT